MAEFRTHSIIGALAGSALAFFSIVLNLLSPVRAVLAAVLFTLSSGLPDLDSETGTAKRFLFEALAVLLPSMIILYTGYETAEEAFLLILFCYFLVRYPLELLFDHFTVHHGIFHSIPMALLFAAGTRLLFHASPDVVSYSFAAAVGLGYLIHLIIDEIWALGFFGLGAKKSFGSSLKWTSESKAATVTVYLLLAIALYFIFCLHFPDCPFNAVTILKEL